MFRLVRMAVVVVAGLLASPASAAAQNNVEIDQDLGPFRVVGSRPAPPAPADVLQYRITWKDGTVVNFKLEDQPARDYRGGSPVRLYAFGSNRLVISNDDRSFEFQVVDSRTGQLVDSFAGFSAEPSPDGRFIVY